MKELEIQNKQKYLDDYYTFEDITLVTEKKHCIHCGN
jgi:ribosomal protein S27AE